MNATVQCREFGTLPGGDGVQSFTLYGAGGLVVEVLTFGGIVRRILTPDRNGHLADVVLGFNTLEEYLAGHPYFGAIVGRVAGRITAATFRHAGETFPLSVNDGKNHLHGGLHGFDKKLWKATLLQRQDGAPSVQLTASSAGGEEGYPGTMHIRVTYTVLPDNTFLIETEAMADRPTPCSLTHHSYFNLAGEGEGSVLDHTIHVFADEYAPTDETMTLLGHLRTLDGSGEDLRTPALLADALPHLFQRHGVLYRLRDRQYVDTLTKAARIVHAASGRVLEVHTTDRYMQLYTGAALDGSLRGKAGTLYGPHHGLCLECEGYPDPWNAEGVESNILLPGNVQRRATAYTFSTASTSKDTHAQP